jgi:citrate lyase subunit beta/citryl-CoA lyase
MRSLLFVPGDSEKKLEKSLGSGADILLLDLEDSVAAANKPAARAITAGFIAAHRGRTAARFYVRVNDLSTGETEADLAAVMKAAPDGIMLPISNSGRDVVQLAASLRVHEAENGIADGATAILPLITETAIGTLSAATYGDVGPRLVGVTWGAEDLAAAVGASTSRRPDGSYTDVFRFARAVTILAASSAGVAAIDTVFPNFRDMDAFRRDCEEGERDGFTGRMAIHPAQVPVINEVFTPSPEAVTHAREVVAAFAQAGDAGVVAIGGKMYDRPHLRQAQRLIARAPTGA